MREEERSQILSSYTARRLLDFENLENHMKAFPTAKATAAVNDVRLIGGDDDGSSGVDRAGVGSTQLGTLLPKSRAPMSKVL
mmetsp:Transcript_60217/g.118064  ORF Transcript_60217/g.118064 Transcript_60217/m.118064 type:complete len:82 (+) Transcript_60217:173-418(+)